MAQNRVSFIFIAIVALSSHAFATSTIYKTCSNARQVSIVNNIDDFANSICNFKLKYQENHSVQFLSEAVFDSIKHIKSKPSDEQKRWVNDVELNENIDKLKDKLTEIHEEEYLPVKKTPLQKSLESLNSKWGNPAKRSATGATSEYLSDLKKALSLTNTGKKVLECYGKAVGPFISGEKTVELSSELKLRGAKMAMGISPDVKNPGKFIKTLMFNSETPPIEALESLAHELQHGCNANRQAILNRAYLFLPVAENPTSEDLAKENTIVEKINQDNAVDEMRAYRVSANIFKDLAVARPDLVCDKFVNSQLFGKQIISSSEYAANLEDKINDGTFPQYIISTYASHGFYKPEHVLEVDANGLTTNKIKPELIQAIKNAGVYVAE